MAFDVVLFPGFIINDKFPLVALNSSFGRPGTECQASDGDCDVLKVNGMRFFYLFVCGFQEIDWLLNGFI